MFNIFFIIGSSGSGKTTAAKAIEQMKLPKLTVCYSDSRPVPSSEQMIREYGSQEEWQRAHTISWVGEMKKEFLSKGDILFDMQTRPLFIEEACKKNSISSYSIILFDCTDDERKKRLIERGQPELVHFDMMNWAKYLREKCVESGYPIIENTHLTPTQSKGQLLSLMGRAL